MSPYIKSKLFAELRAWRLLEELIVAAGGAADKDDDPKISSVDRVPDGDHIKGVAKEAWTSQRLYGHHGVKGVPELVVINPGIILGPPASPYLKAEFTSGAVVTKLVNGEFAAIPDFTFIMADVRDVATLHIRAMTLPGAAGKRILAGNNVCAIHDIAAELRNKLNPIGYSVPSGSLPTPVLWFASWFDSDAAEIYPVLGWKANIATTRFRDLAGVPFRDPVKHSAIPLAEAAIIAGVIPDKTPDKTYEKQKAAIPDISDLAAAAAATEPEELALIKLE